MGSAYGSALNSYNSSNAALGGTMSGAYGNMAGAMGNAYGSAAGTLGNAAGNFGGTTNSALGAMYGTLANAQGQYGGLSQTARGNMLSSLANTNLGAYNTAASYQADFGKLGLGRELGLGQIDMLGKTLPGAYAGLGSAIGSISGAVGSLAGSGGSPAGVGGVNMTAGGSPLGSSYANGSYGSPYNPYDPVWGTGGVPSAAAAGYDYPSDSPPPAATRRSTPGQAWYTTPQSLAPFPDQTPYAANQLGNADQAVLSGLYGTGQIGGGAIGNNSAATYGQLGALSNQLANIPGMFNSGMRGIRSAGQQGYSNLNSGLRAANSYIPGMLNTSMQAMDRDGANAFGSLRNVSNQAGAIPGMLNSTMGNINNDFYQSQGNIGSSLGQGYGAINQSRNDINSSPIASYLMQTGQAGRDQLGSSMATNDKLLSGWVNSGLGNMQSAMASGYGQLNNGINQFYANIPRDGASLLGSALQQGAGQIGALGSQMGSGYGSFANSNNAARQGAMNQVTDLYGMANGGILQPANRPLQSQAQMMAQARADTAAAAAAWRQANPVRPTGNAMFDRMNQAYYR
jgi:hypothetical protein